MFRTIRLYDQGDMVADPVYRYFYTALADGTQPGARVNPLSDFDEVLEAAIWDTPLDYATTSTNQNNTLTLAQKRDRTFTRNANYFNTDNPGNAAWKDFRDAWVSRLESVKDDVNQYWSQTISEVYGKSGFNWYGRDGSNLDALRSRRKIFNMQQQMTKPLHEIDRKMLYSFSLDSFSDRQQLFLYFIRAEATVPTFGGGADSGQQSLAGGRAVALVWRDPYPYRQGGFIRDTDKNNGNDTFSEKPAWWGDDSAYENPWKVKFNQAIRPNVFRSWHDTRILFFKQLEN